MAWTDSRVFTQAILNPLTASAWSTTEPTTYGANGLSADTINVALFNNSVTPDRDAVVGSTFQVIVGQPLTLNVFVEDINTHQTLMIEIQSSITSEKPSVELSRQ